MSQRKGKTKWLSVAEQERQDAGRQSAKSACLQQIRAIYGGLFDDTVVDLIAAQCGYNADEAVLQLAEMADHPDLASSSSHSHHPQQHSARQAAAVPHSVPASTAHPSSAWRVQSPAALVTATSRSASPASRRPSPITQPVTSTALAAWPSPAETQHKSKKVSSASSSAATHSTKSTPYRAVLAPPLSARSATSDTSASPAIRSAPTSPASALKPTCNQRQTSISSTDSTSPHSSSSLPDMPPAAVRSSSTSAMMASQPPARAEARQPTQAISIVSGRSSSRLFTSLHQPVSLLPPTDSWSTYSAAEQEPLYYMMMVGEARERLMQADDEQRQAEQLQEQTPPPVEEELDGFPALRIEQTTGDAVRDDEKVQVDAGELLQLLHAMFGNVREDLILSVVSSLDCQSINLPQLNKCIDTLAAIAAERDQADSEQREIEPDLSGRRLAESDLSDIDIARRMANDPSYSPPRAAVPRTLAHSSASTPSSSSSSRSRHRIKVDLSKPVPRWQPLTSSESLVSPHLSAKWSIAALHTAFPRIDAALIDDMFASCGCQYVATKRTLLEMFPGEMIRGEQGVLPAVMAVQDRKRRPGERQRKDVSEQGDDGDNSQALLLDDAQLERAIGPVLDNHSIPATAVPQLAMSTHAHRRAAFFRAAAAAFMSNKGHLAREYAQRGRDETGHMDDAIGQHAIAVFVRANRDIDCTRQIDLHGLTVREALCILDFVVRRLRRHGVFEVVAVTGRGTNSQGGKSRLRPAVEAYCSRHKYRFNTAETEIRVLFGRDR